MLTAAPQAKAFPGNGPMRADLAELSALKKEVARLRAERNIVKKAAASRARGDMTFHARTPTHLAGLPFIGAAAHHDRPDRPGISAHCFGWRSSRQDARLSIREIAKRTGLSRNTVTKHLAAETVELSTPE